MLYFNMDLGLNIKHYSLEVSFCLTDWGLEYRKLQYGCISYLSVGPLHFSITNRKKLVEIFDGSRREASGLEGKWYVREEDTRG